MREIKFRAWNKQEKKFVRHDILESWAIYALQNHEGSIYDVQQFTGLRDKNEKEIWEGDIIKWTSRNGNPEIHIDNLKWINEYSCYMLMPWCHEPHYADMEVIGNIYENPELLEAK